VNALIVLGFQSITTKQLIVTSNVVK